MTAVLDVLAQHVDQPSARHRCVLLDPLRIRCLDCSRTIDLRGLSTVPVDSTSTSTSTSPAPLHAPDRCTRHPGQRAGACGSCRADQFERLAERNPFQPVADVAAGAAAARAAVQQVATRRRTEKRL